MSMCRVTRKRANAIPHSETDISTVFNLFANNSTSIQPHKRIILSTGIVVEPAFGYLGLVVADHKLSLRGLQVQNYILNMVITNKYFFYVLPASYTYFH